MHVLIFFFTVNFLQSFRFLKSDTIRRTFNTMFDQNHHIFTIFFKIFSNMLMNNILLPLITIIVNKSPPSEQLPSPLTIMKFHRPFFHIIKHFKYLTHMLSSANFFIYISSQTINNQPFTFFTSIFFKIHLFNKSFNDLIY